MGLDNIPHTYPCVKAGTAIINGDDGGLECQATRDADRCPWQTAMVGRGTPIYGMFGTPCWYRGKSGNYMLAELADAGYAAPETGFYGLYEQEQEGPQLPPDYCEELATFMDDHVEAYARYVGHRADASAEIEDYRYAAWWLRWIAEAGDGSDTWY